MSIVVTVLHVLACFVLIVVVLLQTGKGADIGAVFGGSSQTIFGSSGAGNLLTRLTTWTAVLFMLTSLFLTWSSTRHLTSSIADTLPAEPPPLEAPLDGGATAPADGAAAGGAASEAAPADGAASGEAATAPAADAPAEAPAAPGAEAPAADAGAAAEGAANEEAADAAPAEDSAPAAGAAAGTEAAPAQP